MGFISGDKTISKSYLQRMCFLAKEYESVKNKTHEKFKLVQDLCKANGINRQTFLKYYSRYKISGNYQDLLPQKRGPKWKTRRAIPEVEKAVIEARLLGNNRYEIFAILKPRFRECTPSPSGIYNILKRNKLNRLNPPMKESKRRIIKERAGELGHVDCHYLDKYLLANQPGKRRYLVGIIDSCTRIAWVEVVENVKSLVVMFATLKMINFLKSRYDIQFEEVITDNGAEFASPKSKEDHPFEYMLLEIGIKHRYTAPYRPQTNGKIERFWRTLEEDLIEGTHFDSIEHFKEELAQYLLYYNEHRETCQEYCV